MNLFFNFAKIMFITYNFYAFDSFISIVLCDGDEEYNI